MRSAARSSGNTIVLFSNLPLNKLTKDGGWGWWPIGNDPQRLNKLGIKYVVSILNKPNDPEHHKPLFVAILDSQKPSLLRRSAGNGKTRQKLYFESVANLQGIRRAKVPVKRDFYYSYLSKLKITFRRLRFKRVRPAAEREKTTKPHRGADPGPIVGGAVRV
jgi:hypothetical protein